MKRLFSLLLVLLFFGALHLILQARTPQDEFSQLVSQLQKTPDDKALREKIIKFAATANPAPTIPEEARRNFIRGNTAIKDATTADDYANAIKLYNEALKTAPWWSDAYFNLAKAQELHQEFDASIQSLKYFLMSSPSATDARTAQDQIYVLEEKRDKKASTDKAKADAEKAKADAEKAAADKKVGLAKFKKLVENRAIWQYYGSLVDPTSDIFVSAARGLTLSELSGNIFWHINGTNDLFYKFYDDKVELHAVYDNSSGGHYNRPIFRGVPNGANLSDMIWTIVNVGGFTGATIKKEGEQVWFDIDSSTGRLMLSENRPLTSPDSNTRYRYVMFKPQ